LDGDGVDPQLIEARYQRAVFRGGEETLRRDFQLRYGDKWETLWRASGDASEEDVETAERYGDLLVELVRGRIDEEEVAALYVAYGRNLSLEKELELGMELLGHPGGVEKLLRWGLVMHFDDEVAAAPPYLAKLLIELAGRARPERPNLREELEAYSHDGATMAYLEALLTEELDVEMHRVFYGDLPRELRVGRIAVYREDVGLVVTPLYSIDEVLEALLQVKERRAHALAKALSLHGEYEFSTKRRCGLHYLSVDGSMEKSGVVAICPWLSYSRKLWRRLHNMVLIVEGQRPPQMPRLKFGVVFIRGGEAEVVRPATPSKLFDYIVDVLYSVGFAVSEL
jgi:hypothetical protein